MALTVTSSLLTESMGGCQQEGNNLVVKVATISDLTILAEKKTQGVLNMASTSTSVTKGNLPSEKSDFCSKLALINENRQRKHTIGQKKIAVQFIRASNLDSVFTSVVRS